MVNVDTNKNLQRFDCFQNWRWCLFLGPLTWHSFWCFLKLLKGPNCQENCSKKWFLHVQTTWGHFELLCLGLRFLSFWVDFLPSKELLVVRWKVPWCKDEESPLDGSGFTCCKWTKAFSLFQCLCWCCLCSSLALILVNLVWCLRLKWTCNNFRSGIPV